MTRSGNARRRVRLAAAVLTLVGAVTMPSVAMSGPEFTIQKASVNLGATVHATRSGEDNARLDSVAHDAVDRHIQEQADDNRLLSESDVSVALVEDPLSRDRIGWERGSAPARVDVFRAARADGSAADAGFAVAFTETGSAEPTAGGGGLGYEPGINPVGNMYLYNDGCRTIFWSPPRSRSLPSSRPVARNRRTDPRPPVRLRSSGVRAPASTTAADSGDTPYSARPGPQSERFSSTSVGLVWRCSRATAGCRPSGTSTAARRSGEPARHRGAVGASSAVSRVRDRFAALPPRPRGWVRCPGSPPVM